MESKKTKLTISGSPKKVIKKFETTFKKDKKSLVTEKSPNKFLKKGNLSKTSGLGVKSSFTKKPFNKSLFSKASPNNKNFPNSNDFEKRKLAEQRATKRLRGESETKEKKSKLGSNKREVYSINYSP